MDTINITDKFQGYIWKSDQPKPDVYNCDKSAQIILDDSKNPFIIEGQLYDTENRKSYSIKYVDGEYRFKIYVVKEKDFNDVNNSIVEYLANRMEGVKRLQFLQYWKSKQDLLCDDMEVLQPAEFVFVGFNDKEK